MVMLMKETFLGSTVMCPECFKGRLIENYNKQEAQCSNCDTEFKVIGQNTVSYKDK